jgi:UDPglucose--hexose-1-phosphate uridylyltransferase
MKNKKTNISVKAKNKNKANSQLRQDIVTGDWVVIATGRGKRPSDFVEKNKKKSKEEIKDCLFCDPVASGQEEDVLIYNTGEGDWTLRVFPNKYPAFARPVGGRISHKEEGPYFWMDGVGYHEVIVTRDHFKHIGLMDPIWVAEILDSYQTRYLDLMNKKSVRYIEIFHNHGKKAGASISHPHSQLVAIPVVSPYIPLELTGSEEYYRSHKKCVFCDIVEWEIDYKKRVIFENEDFIVIAPFASRVAFEMWVIPKKHSPYFERISDEEKISGGQALHQAIRKIGKVLDEPDFNFYLHTAPCDGKDYPHYHWHIEILPKTSTWAGFELSTGIEISAMEPELAAEYLREV